VGIRHAGGGEISWCSVTVVADTGRLQSQIDAANALDSTLYTPESWAPLLPALEAAKSLLATPGSGQDGVDAAANVLETALVGLVRRDAVSSAPRDVVATASGDRVNVQWSAPASQGGTPVVAYEVTVGDRVVQSQGSEPTASVSGLPVGEYTVTVRAQNGGGWSEASAPVTVKIEAAPVTPSVSVKGTPKVGGRIDVTGTGFKPGVEYTIQLRSAPADLGTVTAQDDGTFTFRGTVPTNVEAGDHSIVVMLDGADIASAPVRIAAAASPGNPGSPSTPGTPGGSVAPGGTHHGDGAGDDSGWLPVTGLTGLIGGLVLALLLLVSGLAALKVRRSRTD